MARLIFECRDKDGNHVKVETSEKELGELLGEYDKLLAHLQGCGFTPISARGKGKPKELVKFDGKTCPACKSDMWDNRQKNAANGKKGPDFRCKSANCTGATPDKNDPTKKWPFALWADQYELSS